ncbi:hypothetical protein [Thiomicrorhabdus indica]|uniref:hypothetical protein n=1 Tax=Thiomicrorhabdus indica TaxID=2267253 RepID=UPI00102DD170|nr:hypothetical protein [Thiomicrorhabdus indica]
MNSSDPHTESSVEALQSVAQPTQALKDIIPPMEPVFGFDVMSVIGVLVFVVLLLWLIRAVAKRSQGLIWMNWLRKQKKQLQTLDINQLDEFQAWLWQTAAELHKFQQEFEKMEASQHFISTSAQNTIKQWQNIAFQDFRRSENRVSRETMNELLDELLKDAWKNVFNRPVEKRVI